MGLNHCEVNNSNRGDVTSLAGNCYSITNQALQKLTLKPLATIRTWFSIQYGPIYSPGRYGCAFSCKPKRNYGALRASVPLPRSILTPLAHQKYISRARTPSHEKELVGTAAEHRYLILADLK